MTILDHKKFNECKGSLIHTVLVESETEPEVREVAVAVGYHPHGYGLDVIHCIQQGNNLFEAKWESASQC